MASREFKALIARADVLLEFFRPGVLDRLGLGSDRVDGDQPQARPLRAIRIRADRPLPAARRSRSGLCGDDRNAECLPQRGGFGHSVSADGRPCRLLAGGDDRSLPPSWPASAPAAAASSTSASWSRLLFLQPLPLTLPPPPEGGILNGGAACYNVYRTADGRFVTLSAVEPKFWASFCTAMKRPEWIARHHEPLPQQALIADVAAVFREQPLRSLDRTAHARRLLLPGRPRLPRGARASAYSRARAGAPRRTTRSTLHSPPSSTRCRPGPRRPLSETTAEDVLADWA